MTKSASSSFWRPRAAGILTILAVVAAITWYYHWTVDPSGAIKPMGTGMRDYYNLLAGGFAKGQLSLDLPADPALASMKNPYDPVERAGRGLHDASYYNGKYYIYFGVTPAVVLLLPVRLLTGLSIDQSHVTLLFCTLGFWISALLLWKIRSEWFPRVPTPVLAMAIAVTGLASMTLLLLRRPSVWEVPLSCAYFFSMAALWCLFKTLTSRSPALWLALASTAVGLCIGARPTYLPAAAILLAPVLMALQSNPRDRSWQRLLVAAMAPISIIGAGLAAYNYLRFGDILEFGQAYQMAGEDATTSKFFSPSYILFNLRLYFLEPAGLSPHFPFITIISNPPAPKGHLCVENPYGIIPNIPWVILCITSPFWIAKCSGLVPAARWFCGILLVSSLAVTSTVMLFGATCGRYMVDFAPSYLLLASLCLFATFNLTNRIARTAAIAAACLAGIWSVLFGTLVGLQHNNLLQAMYPDTYVRTAKAANHLSLLTGKLTGHRYGPLLMEVSFPAKPASPIEPLLVTGTAFRSDYMLVHYIGQDSLRLLFIHTNNEPIVGPTIRYTPGASHKLLVEMASLYPPAEHPWWDDFSEVQRDFLCKRVKITMDGQTVLEGSMPCYDATSFQPRIGSAIDSPAFKNTFTGKILSVTPAEASRIQNPELNPGPVTMKVTLPPFVSKHSEPLLCSGSTGKGDLIFITYEDAGHISIGHDHWGSGANQSGPIAIDPGAVQTLFFDSSMLRGIGDSADLVISLNGTVVLSSALPLHPAAPQTMTFGENSIQASTANPRFTGKILSLDRTTH